MNARGSALLEALPAITLVSIALCGLLVTSYLLFARMWLQYQHEQALLCLQIERASSKCRRRFLSETQRLLPWGHVTRFTPARSLDVELRVEWRWSLYRWTENRTLDLRAAARKKDLRW